MIKTVITKPGETLTSEELERFKAEVEHAKSMPITFDDDCGELSPAMLKAFKSATVQRNRRPNV